MYKEHVHILKWYNDHMQINQRTQKGLHKKKHNSGSLKIIAAQIGMTFHYPALTAQKLQ